MNFVTFETMYQYLWELIYNLFKIFGVELSDPTKK
jgi:hypothetical protein